MTRTCARSSGATCTDCAAGKYSCTDCAAGKYSGAGATVCDNSFAHYVCEGFSLVSRFEELKVAGIAEQWCMVVEVFSFDDRTSRWSQAARSSGAWFPRSKLPEARIEQRRRGTVISRCRRNASPHAVQSHQHLNRTASSVRQASSQVRQRRLAPLPAKAATPARTRVGELRSAPTTMPASSRSCQRRRASVHTTTALHAGRTQGPQSERLSVYCQPRT